MRVGREDEGQMVVEMAVVVPVMVVVAIVVANLMWFLEACARFDRVSFDEVIALAVSPAGEAQDAGQEHAVSQAIQAAMGSMRGVEVSVRTESFWSDLVSGAGFSMAPHLTRYVCTLTYAPWPSGLSIAGVDAGIPGSLLHERAIVVDRYRAGVVF